MGNSNNSRCREHTSRIIQNFQLIWLDESINENDDDFRNSIKILRQIINTIKTFIDADECINFINKIQDETVFVICSGAFGERIVPIIDDKKQINAIYILCRNKTTQHEKWAKEWSKVKGIYTNIEPIRQALKQATRDSDHNAVSISFATTDNTPANALNKDILDCSFMYTQILKEILLTINFNQRHITDFLNYSRIQFADNSFELRNVDNIEKEYRDHQPIWWYTCETFLYSMLNRALRLMDIDIIIRMGFFICDLHKNLADHHRDQFSGHTSLNSFIVYRGQNLSLTDFNQIKQNQGGLLAFNNFLSTSKNRNVSLGFINSSSGKSDLVSVLFVMHIDPSIQSTPYANVDKISAIGGEEEILFSMHSVFRIRQMKQLPGSTLIWEVELSLTDDNDPELRQLAEHIQKQISSNHKAWHRLGKLLIKLAKFDKAEELYGVLLKQTNDQNEIAHIFHQLGWINDDQGKYTEALEYYEKSLKIYRKTLPANHLELATLHSNIGSVCRNMGEYSKALEYYEKTLFDNHPSLSNSYNNIGSIYDKLGDYPKALEYFEKSLEIMEKTLPANHPELATLYNNIGSVYGYMGESAKALEYCQKSLEIRTKILPVNHPDLAVSYNSIGCLYKSVGDYSNALAYFEKSLEIKQQTLPPNHSSLATSYNNIGLMYNQMHKYSKALEYYEKDLEISKQTLPANHSDLAISYNNIAWVYRNIGDYKNALEYFEHSLNILQRSLPTNHPHISSLKDSIETMKKKL